MDLTTTDRDDLRGAWNAFRSSMVFPRVLAEIAATEEELEELGDIKGRTVLYNMEVAGPILSLIEGYPPRHALKRNDELRQAIETLIREGSPDAAAEAREYARYVDALHGLVERVAGYKQPVEQPAP